MLASAARSSASVLQGTHGPESSTRTGWPERELVADDGVTRVYRQPAGDDAIRLSLQQMHEAWVRVGSPENGPIADELVQRLAQAYLAAPAESQVEQEIVEYADYLGLTDMLGALAETYNESLRREEYADVATDAFRGLPPEAIAKAGELVEPELLDQVRRGIADPDKLRAALTLRAEAAREVVGAERKRSSPSSAVRQDLAEGEPRSGAT